MKTMENTGRKPHVLDSIRMPEGRLDWQSRLKKWHSPLSFDERMSWLHTNHYRDGNGPEHFLFYLNIADRYGENPEVFKSSTKDDKHESTAMDGYSSRADLKSRLSKKAFSVLCTEFFTKENGRSPVPYIVVYQDPLFSKLLWFFRPYGGRGGWDNLRPSNTGHLGKNGGQHYVSVANSYAKEFIVDAWAILNSRWFKCWDGDKPKSAIAQPHWELIVDTMDHLNMFDSIGIGQYGPRPLIFKNMVRKVLRENNILIDESRLDDIHVLGKTLEPLVKKGGSLVKYLYMARLHVFDPEKEFDKVWVIP